METRKFFLILQETIQIKIQFFKRIFIKTPENFLEHKMKYLLFLLLQIFSISTQEVKSKIKDTK